MGFGRKLLIGTIVIAGGLYSAGWFAAQQYAYSALDDAADRVTRGRNGAQCGDREVSGFPLSFDVICRQTTVSLAPGIKAEVAGVSTSAPLLSLGRVEARFSSPARVEAARHGVAGEARFTSASNFGDLWIDGARRLGGAVENLQLTLSGPRSPIKSLAIGKGTSEVGSSSTANSLDVTADVKSLDLVRTSGPNLPRLDIKVRATLLDIGSSIRDDRQFDAWLAAGGRTKVTEGTVTAQQTSVSVSGDLMVSPAGLLTGKLKVRLVGINGVPDLVEGISPGSRERARQAVGVMAAMTKLVQTESGPAQEIEVSLANGVMTVGFIPIAVIPPIF